MLARLFYVKTEASTGARKYFLSGPRWYTTPSLFTTDAYVLGPTFTALPVCVVCDEAERIAHGV